MKISCSLLLLLLLIVNWRTIDNWHVSVFKQYRLFYQQEDKKNKKDYVPLFNNGINSVEHFFAGHYKNKFDIYIHPNRNSLDDQWQKDWKQPNFKSECWM